MGLLASRWCLVTVQERNSRGLVVHFTWTNLAAIVALLGTLAPVLLGVGYLLHRVETTEAAVAEHVSSTAPLIQDYYKTREDVRRNDQRYQEILRRLDRIEGKLDAGGL